MKSRTILSASLLVVTSFACAEFRLDSYYTYNVTGAGSARLRDVEEVMEGGFVNNPNGGWGVSSSIFGESNTGTGHLSFTSDSEPFLRDSLLFGVIQGLPQDLIDNNPDQKHLVLFVDPLAALRMNGVSYDTIFNTPTDPLSGVVLTENAIIDAIEIVHTDISDEDKVPYYRMLDTFRNDIARRARVGVNGAEGSIWFGAGSDFSIVSFSDGLTIGSGTSNFTVVPEPATMLALGVGALGLLRRRRKA